MIKLCFLVSFLLMLNTITSGQNFLQDDSVIVRIDSMKYKVVIERQRTHITDSWPVWEITAVKELGIDEPSTIFPDDDCCDGKLKADSITTVEYWTFEDLSDTISIHKRHTFLPEVKIGNVNAEVVTPQPEVPDDVLKRTQNMLNAAWIARYYDKNGKEMVIKNPWRKQYD